jgi:hypothetical protein
MLDSDKPCPHHWVIDSPDGRHLLPGVCKLCGAVRLNFRATCDDMDTHWKPHIPGLHRAPATYVFEI